METEPIDTIIQRAKRKDPKALDAIYNMYHRKMTGICMKIVKEDEDTAHDLVHDAFILAFASLEKLKDNEKLGEWLATITKNVALKYKAQKRKVQVEPLSAIQPDVPMATDSASQPDASVNSRDILALVAQLPEGYARIFRLSVIEGFTHKEIADMLGIAPHSSSSQLSRAKKLLRQMMQYRKWSVVILLLLSLPLYFVLLHRDKEEQVSKNVAATRKTRKRIDLQPKRDTPPDGHTEDYEAAIAQHHETTTDTLIIMSVPDTTRTVVEDNIPVEVVEDSTDTAPKPTGVNPAINPNRYLEKKVGRKKQKWQIMIASSLGSDLNQHGYRPFHIEDNFSDEATTMPDFVGTWEEYRQYLHTLNPELMSAGERAMLEIADHNSGEISEQERHDMPLTFGLSLTKTIHDRWGIETGLQYARLTSRFTTGSNGYALFRQQKIHYLGIPLKLTYRVLDYKRLSAYASAGLAVHIPVSGSAKENYLVNWHTVYSDSERVSPPWQWSTNASVGLQYRLTPNIGLFIEPSVNWFISSEDETRTRWTARPLTFTAPLGLRIVW